MGVHGLWQLLQPVGRPVTLESLQGKRLAIDSSIWLYHFQRAMRDRDGRTLSHAHLLGFLWRILKLLFYGIQPVFVFDGGAPIQKRRTIANRKHRRTLAGESVARAAEKLLAAQLRQAALRHVAPPPPELDPGTVYYDSVGRSNSPPRSARLRDVAPVPPKQAAKDPYELPAMPREAWPPADARDLRFATEAELRDLIKTIAPEDLDIHSELFRSLPPELQYELVGDLRAQSRGTSFQRLQEMLAAAPTPIDFSKAQVAYLKTRNDLTQKVLTVTDEIGRAHIQVPLRVAGSRSREYILTHIEGGDGGFALGAHAPGSSRERAIDVDDEPKAWQNAQDEWDPAEMDDVDIAPTAAPDPELDALVQAEHDPMQRKERALAFLHARAEQHRRQKRRETGVEALEERLYGHIDEVHTSEALFHADDAVGDDEWDDVPLEVAAEQHGTLDAAAEHAMTLPRAPADQAPEAREPAATLGEPRIGTQVPKHERPPPTSPEVELAEGPVERERVTPAEPKLDEARETLELGEPDERAESAEESAMEAAETVETPAIEAAEAAPAPVKRGEAIEAAEAAKESPVPQEHRLKVEPEIELPPRRPTPPMAASPAPADPTPEASAAPLGSPRASPEPRDPASPYAWSPSPSPEPVRLGADGFPLPSAEEVEHLEAAEEQDMAKLEQDQRAFASFLSETSGRSLPEMQQEVDAEVEALRQERARLRRSEEEITSQMTAEIQAMLRLFGLPYITAPMEAEAQCAQLAAQRLVDGIITDDSDVFLFGGTPVYRHMFNHQRMVECYRLPDMARELGLDQERLIQLAFLLGSDYTEGLSGVGPVLAMEILSVFHGLPDFAQWWRQVQTGADTEILDRHHKVRRRIKRALREKVHLSADWPDASERRAYTHPIVDDSDEPFVWGQADLDAVRAFLYEHLRWPPSKTDEYVRPVIEQQHKAARLQRLQTTLDQAGFTAPAPTAAGRIGSARLQQVVRDFREAQGVSTSGAEPGTEARKRPRLRRDK
ncbi:DNA repair protein rad2 [Malassezia caprae]|uniref:DNA repair protein rad2 n=1 Tax=Malassezia caprae TaxID=1381934 RepID=A0AAF0E5P5_9BASI|nr:DNA repair protein rad2 [Malassezia caprae]